MANQKLTALTSIPAIDRAADLIYIVDVSAGTSNKVTPNFMLNITGAPLGTTDSATVSNKVLDNSNTLTVKDANLVVQDDGDTTKQFKFQASGITTSTTRTFTVPNFDATLATLAGTETLTNKTLTSPTINTATIVNPTITANSIAGFSVSTTGTIYGVAVTTGVIQTAGTVNGSSLVAGTVNAAALGTGSVTPEKLVSGTGTSWVSQVWSPSIVGFSANPTGVYRFIVVGKMVTLFWEQSVSGTSNATNFTLSLPFTAATIAGMIWQNTTQMVDAGSSAVGVANVVSAGTVLNFYKDIGLNAFTNSGLKRSIGGQLTYEAA